MVNVVLKRCAYMGCETFPSFGLPGQPGVQYCRLHKLPGMQRRAPLCAYCFSMILIKLPGLIDQAGDTQTESLGHCLPQSRVLLGMQSQAGIPVYASHAEGSMEVSSIMCSDVCSC